MLRIYDIRVSTSSGRLDTGICLHISRIFNIRSKFIVLCFISTTAYSNDVIINISIDIQILEYK